MTTLASGVSVEAARRSLAQKFRQCGIETPELDARLIVGHTLGLDHATLTAASRRVLTTAEADALLALQARRLAREPVARILGRKEIWGVPFKLNSETLVPRPETETVVEAALAAIDAPSLSLPQHQGVYARLPRAVRGRERWGSHVLRIADLGTGSGALLLALLSELPSACGIGTDISAGALGCARDNAAALGLAGRAAFVACDYASALEGPIDLLVANPPYVARGDIAALPGEVRDFDPRRALDGGPDGLDGYRAIAADARRLLAPAGVLVLELGFGQLSAVTSLLPAAGLAPAAMRQDLAGVVRALVIRLLAHP
jgi:release factor glutamine methyltransferase